MSGSKSSARGAPPMERKIRQHISNFFRATQTYVGTIRLIIMVVVGFTSMQELDTNDRTIFLLSFCCPDHEVLWVQLRSKRLPRGFYFPDSSYLSSTLVCHWEPVYARTLVPATATCRVTFPWLRSYCGRKPKSSWHEASRKAFPAQTNNTNSNQKGRNLRWCPR